MGRNWTPRRQPSAIAWKNKLWVFPEAGDITDQHEIHCSSDQGATWTEVDTRGFVGPAKFSTTVVHDGRLFWLGGDSSTHPEQQLREVTLQRNGALAQKKTAKAPGGFSMSITALSFGGHLWLLGGSSPRQGLSPSEKHSDRVYRSHTSDPLRFTQVKAPTPPRRTGGRALVYRDQMWILGGRHWKPNGDSEPLNDVWSTKDPAKGWTKVEATHSFPPRDLFAACVWRDRMWVGGGFGPLTGSFDIWHSVDGAYWNKLKVGAAPRQRLLTSLVAQPDRLILLGGELPREGEGEIRRTTNEIWYLE
ncbi:MAG: hypothetical protein JKY65_04550 [Planctomycetes bacterium]|nr:hypothetical protein [Planctomycetota bacterium]